VHLGESRALGVIEEIPLVEPGQDIVCGRIDQPTHLRDDVLNRRNVVAPKHLRRLRKAKAVNALIHRDPAARLENSIERSEDAVLP
jgi:hypothetical protein